MVMPISLLEKSVDKRVSVLLKDGRTLEGKLAGFDEYMNMVLQETVRPRYPATRADAWEAPSSAAATL